jgi:hypothetical protein
MRGTIRWMQVNPDTNEYLYDLGLKEFNTDKKSIRDTIVELLTGDWEYFGDDGDCLVIRSDERDEISE